MDAIAQSALTFMKVCKKIHQALAKEGESLHVYLGRWEVWDRYNNKMEYVMCSSAEVHLTLAGYSKDISRATQDMTSPSVVHKCVAEVYLQEVENEHESTEVS